jgi:hypothetical protein
MAMRMPGIVLLLVSVSLFFGGCQYIQSKSVASESKPVTPVMSAVPLPSPYVQTRQKKMQAVHHWSVLAKDVANMIHAKLLRTLPEYQEPVYVAPAGITPFDKAFQQLLITNLVEKGIVVSNNYNDPLVLSFDTQVVSHGRALERIRGDVPGKEVMMTLSLMFKGAYLMRKSSIYYINDSEWYHYVQKAEATVPGVSVYTLVDK